MIKAQRDRIKMMITDDVRSNGIDELLLFREYIDNLLKNTIAEELVNYDNSEINDLEAIELFVDVPYVFYSQILKLIQYLKEHFCMEKVYASKLLYLDYNSLLSKGIIDLNTLVIIRHRLISLQNEQLTIVEDEAKQKKYVIPSTQNFNKFNESI